MSEQNGLPPVTPDRLRDRAADLIVAATSTWTFLAIFAVTMIGWIVLNSSMLARMILHHPFDPYPYILWNLVMSTDAVVQGTLLLISNKRKDSRDQARAERIEIRITRVDKRVAVLHADHDRLMRDQMVEIRTMSLLHSEHRSETRLLIMMGKLIIKLLQAILKEVRSHGTNDQTTH
ncbi:MAG TPA: DUF1003 domain-containing protein [Gammaproteobacteria bacterium]|nr:DUF1003 domain-containing protein [Gammaproteobacteria bacterium]